MTRDEALARVTAFLVEHRVSDEEIERARSGDVLDLLVADCLFVPGQRRYSEQDVSDVTGMPQVQARQFWRALGFPDVEPEEKVFTDLDVEAVSTLRTMVELGAADVDTALQLARVIGTSMARIAEAEVAPAVRGMMGGAAMAARDAESGLVTSVEAADRFVRMADRSLPAMARLLEFAWRRHVQAAVRRAMLQRTRGGSGALPDLCVGFADMVGFTMLSQQLSEDELPALVSRFEDVAHDTVTAGGGRVVKMIGDEVMFITDSACAAAHIGLGLAEAYADDELLTDVRVALAVGPVLVQDGDYYGPVVNLASRSVAVAAPGSVLVTEEFQSALQQELERAKRQDSASDAATAAFACEPLRPRVIKDLGRVQLWTLHRPGVEPHAIGRRIGRRWERLSDVLREIDDLRARGERLMSGGAPAVGATEAMEESPGEPVVPHER